MAMAQMGHAHAPRLINKSKGDVPIGTSPYVK
jgi:hypothetical protein